MTAARLQAKANEIEENSKLEVLEQVRSILNEAFSFLYFLQFVFA